MNDYTPTTDQVRDLYEFGGKKASESARSVGAEVDIEETLAMFDRWLAAHDAKVKAEALREAAELVASWTPEGGWNRSTAEPDEWQVEMWEHNQALATRILAEGDTE